MSLSRDPSDATSDRDRASHSHSQRDTWVHALQCRANELINSSVKDKLVHANYRLHVVNKWKNLYFPYNEAKYILGSNAVSQFDVYFDGVIRALVNFIEHMVELIQHDTLCTMEAFGVMKDEEIIDREFFKLRSRIMDLKKFQKFNTYFVLKFVQKYYRPILLSQHVIRSHATSTFTTGSNTENPSLSSLWSESGRSYYCYHDLINLESSVDSLHSNMLDNYMKLKTYYCGDMGNESSVYGAGELEYPKRADIDPFLNPLSLKIGMKAGVVIGCIVILLVKKYLMSNIELRDTYDHPGNNIFAAYAAYLLYRLTWLMNVVLWNNRSIQYIHFFKFRGINSQTFLILNELLTEVGVFLILFVLFAESLSEYSFIFGLVNPGYVALTTLIALIAKLFYHFIVHYGTKVADRGVFTISIVIRCLVTPYYRATFRDKIAANILTSFSRPVSDLLRGTCWLFSGQLSKSNRYTTMDDVEFCEDNTFYAIIVSVQLFFVWIRMAQCIRDVKEANWKIYPSGLNALKYFLGFIKIYILIFPGQSLSKTYFAMLVVNSLFRWYWDVVMDWGLGSCSWDAEAINFSAPWGYPSDDELGLHTSEVRMFFMESMSMTKSEQELDIPRISIAANDVSSTVRKSVSASSPLPPATSTSSTLSRWKYFLLRPNLYLFDRLPLIYYAAIVLDLILRLLSAVSFLPQSKLVDVLGSEVTFYLGCFEILRRAMWLTFRLEWEHIKFVALCNKRKEELSSVSDNKTVMNILQKEN